MLAAQKASKKKILINSIFIFVMFLGTVFFLYQNYSLTSSRESNITYMEEKMESELSLEENDDTNIIEEEVLVDNKEEDDDLFKNRKFKNLQETFVKDSSFDMGKDNPFIAD